MGNPEEKVQEDRTEFLRSAFSAEQETLATQLKLSSISITHNGVMGEVNEQHFIHVLRKYLPNRYAIDHGIVIDSNGVTSDQIDIVIFDLQYTPTLLDQIFHRYIPAEAVYCVLEVKPTINKAYLDYAGIKAESVRRLQRTSVPIIHSDGERPAKPPFPIISGIVAGEMEWANGMRGQPFLTNLASLKGNEALDCGLALSDSCFDTFDNHLRLGPVHNSLVYFIFRLLQKLQSLGTVPAIDWDRYASIFSKNDH